MRYNIGDKVRFLNDVGGGTIVKYIDKGTVAVLNDDEFEIPVSIKELIAVKTGDYDAQKTTDDDNAYYEKIKAVEAEVEPEDDYEKDDDNIYTYLAFVPVNQKDLTESDLELHIINDSNYHVYYNVMIKFGAMHVSHPGKLEANSKFPLKTFKKELFNDMDSLVVQCMYYKNNPHDVKPNVSKEIKLNPVKFFRESSFTENDFFHENAYMITVFEEAKPETVQEMPEISNKEIKKAIQEKEFDSRRGKRPRKFQSSKRKEIREIDLHINELLDDTKGLSNTEMLEVQMKHFDEEMQKAIKEKVLKIVFIHGLGNGTLKMEVRKELDRKYKKYRHQDASFKEYGFGATMVYLH
ncbi:MAG: hypothetical protein B6I20_12500 [Bacteroidetes bacterium 4572_117]|nr:MAG: hypothetical protein B6I20_12500 [Bacteroidetes bacterium 4572_117]